MWCNDIVNCQLRKQSCGYGTHHFLGGRNISTSHRLFRAKKMSFESFIMGYGQSNTRSKFSHCQHVIFLWFTTWLCPFSSAHLYKLRLHLHFKDFRGVKNFFDLGCMGHVTMKQKLGNILRRLLFPTRNTGVASGLFYAHYQTPLFARTK